MNMLLFAGLSGLGIVCSTLVIVSANPVHSVLALILVFCNMSGLMLLLDLDFLAMLFIVVYVGAIAVLFLFVVMMLDIGVSELESQKNVLVPVGAMFGLILYSEVLSLVAQHSASVWAMPSASVLTISHCIWDQAPLPLLTTIGGVLYTHTVHVFLMASLVLLVAMVGAIVLTMTKRLAVRKQEPHLQNSRDSSQTIAKLRD